MINLSEELFATIWIIASIGISAFVINMLLIPLGRTIASKFNLVDKPDAERKLHDRPIPLSGGISVFISIGLALLISIGLNFDFWASNISNPIELIGLGVGATLLLVVGVLDDKFGIRGRQKLLAQIFIGSILIFSGFSFDSITLFGYSVPLLLFAYPIAMIWILGTINSVNLLDGADGLAATVGSIIATALMFMAIIHGKYVDAALAGALAGALIAFLFFNLPPATVFLGDAGSMLIGLMLGALAIRCSFKESFAYAFVAPVSVLAIPFFDSFIAIVRRTSTGRSIYAVDRGHLHHTLLRNGLSPGKMLVVVGGLTLVTSLAGTICVITKQEIVAAIGVGSVILFLVAGRIFGFAEFQLLRNRARRFAGSFLVLPKITQKPDDSVQLQGEYDWDEVWQTIKAFAEKHQLNRVRLDLNLPWLHEGFHGDWVNPVPAKSEVPWNSKIPLISGRQNFGRIEVIGCPDRTELYPTLQGLAELVSELQNKLALISQEVVSLEDTLTISVDDSAEIPKSLIEPLLAPAVNNPTTNVS